MLLMLHNQLTKRNKRFYISPGQACIRKCNRKQSRTKTQGQYGRKYEQGPISTI